MGSNPAAPTNSRTKWAFGPFPAIPLIHEHACRAPTSTSRSRSFAGRSAPTYVSLRSGPGGIRVLAMGDLYTVLGVDQSADLRTIKARYRRLARRHHPDLGGDQERMMVLNKAWSVLSDPDRRARYDARIRRRTAAQKRHSPDGHTVLDFGRYEGHSLAEIAAADDNYLEWLRRTPTGRALQREIDELLRARTDAMEAQRPVAAATKSRRWGRAKR